MTSAATLCRIFMLRLTICCEVCAFACLVDWLYQKTESLGKHTPLVVQCSHLSAGSSLSQAPRGVVHLQAAKYAEVGQGVTTVSLLTRTWNDFTRPCHHDIYTMYPLNAAHVFNACHLLRSGTGLETTPATGNMQWQLLLQLAAAQPAVVRNTGGAPALGWDVWLSCRTLECVTRHSPGSGT